MIGEGLFGVEEEEKEEEEEEEEKVGGVVGSKI